MLCPKLTVRLNDEANDEKTEWYYEDGVSTYLSSMLAGVELLPAEPFTGSMQGNNEQVDWAVHWLPEPGRTDHRELRPTWCRPPRAAPT